MRVWRTCSTGDFWSGRRSASQAHYVFYGYIMRTERVVTLQITATAAPATARFD